MMMASPWRLGLVLHAVCVVASSAGRWHGGWRGGGEASSPVQICVLEGETVECTRLSSAVSGGAVASDGTRFAPNHEMATQLEMPRGFMERVRTLAHFPRAEQPHGHLHHFCFARRVCGPFPSEGEPAYFHTFSLTREDGTREYGACLSTLRAERYGLHGLLEGRTAARPLSVVVFSRWPLFRIYEAFLRQLWLERHEHRWDVSSDATPLCARLDRFVRACAEHGALCERAAAPGLPLTHSLAPVLHALRWQPEALGALVLCALTNRKALVVSADASLPPALIHLVTELVYPLEYPGVVVPFLPRSLHPEPGTLINDNVAPFLIGCDAELAKEMAPLSDELLVVDLDGGGVRYPAPDPYDAWLQAPAAERLVTALRAHAYSPDELSAPGVRAACLRFVLDIVDLDDGALPNSAHPADRACAAQWRLLSRLADEVQEAVRHAAAGELEPSVLDAQAALCKAAYVKQLLGSEPVGGGGRRDSNLPLVREALGSTACAEYLSVPPAARRRLPEPQWLHWRRLGGQLDHAVREHMAARLSALALLADALARAGVALARTRAPAFASDVSERAGGARADVAALGGDGIVFVSAGGGGGGGGGASACGGGAFPEPSVDEVTAFCEAFDSPAVGELVAYAECAMHVGAAEPGADAAAVAASAAAAADSLAGTPAALAGVPELGGAFVSCSLFVSGTHLCFETRSAVGAARKEVLALGQITTLELRELDDSISVRSATGAHFRLVGIERAAALHALIAECIGARASDDGHAVHRGAHPAGAVGGVGAGPYGPSGPTVVPPGGPPTRPAAGQPTMPPPPGAAGGY